MKIVQVRIAVDDSDIDSLIRECETVIRFMVESHNNCSLLSIKQGELSKEDKDIIAEKESG